MKIINIRPLSVNQAYKGRKFKTPAHNRYKRDLRLILPKICDIPDGEFWLIVEWGFSEYSKSDVDNPVKLFIDAMQERYGFNDLMVKGFWAEKEKVSKGQEYVKFHICNKRPFVFIRD